jgi:hypothetical protein
MSFTDQIANTDIGGIVVSTVFVPFQSPPSWNSNPSEDRTDGDLLFSNSPETVSVNNRVLFYSPVTGCRDVQLFAHHRNCIGGPATMRVILRNDSAATVIVSPGVNGWRGAGVAVKPRVAGKNALLQYLQRGSITTLYLNPSSQVNLEIMNIPSGHTGNLITDFHSNANIKAYVVFGNPNLNANTYYEGRITHTRGTFKGKEITKRLTPTYLMSHTNQPTIIGIRVSEAIPTGVDQTMEAVGGAGEGVTLKGSYGMRYWLEFPIYNNTSATMCVAVVANARAGAEHPYAGAARDIGAESVVRIPSDPDEISHRYQGVVVSKNYINPFSGFMKRFVTKPPGGSGLPIDFLVVPCS